MYYRHANRKTSSLYVRSKLTQRAHSFFPIHPDYAACLSEGWHLEGVSFLSSPGALPETQFWQHSLSGIAYCLHMLSVLFLYHALVNKKVFSHPYSGLLLNSVLNSVLSYCTIPSGPASHCSEWHLCSLPLMYFPWGNIFRNCTCLWKCSFFKATFIFYLLKNSQHIQCLMVLCILSPLYLFLYWWYFQWDIFGAKYMQVCSVYIKLLFPSIKPCSFNWEINFCPLLTM